MRSMDEIPTYTIYTSGSNGEQELLSFHGLTIERLHTSIHAYAARERITVGTLLGVSVDGVIYTPEKNWSRKTAEGLTEIGIIPWPQLLDS